MAKARVVHYVNQFFAGIGGEEKADVKPHVATELPPITQQLAKLFGDDVEIVATIVCGDSYFNENLELASAEVFDMIKAAMPDFLIAGPAFNAGRYGMACGTVVKMVQDKMSLKAVTAMYEENPGVDVFRKDVMIVKTSDSAAGMRKALPAVVSVAKKLMSGEALGEPDDEGMISRGLRVNTFTDERGSMRAVKMLVSKLKGESYTTEYPMPAFDRVAPNQPVKDITKAKIAIVTSGGIVPKHNPDRIESSSASKFGSYDISKFDMLSWENFETAHGGYDPVYANLDPNRVLPVDVLRDLEKEGKIGELFGTFYTTVGNGTSVASSVKFAGEIAKDLLANNVTAVILTST